MRDGWLLNPGFVETDVCIYFRLIGLDAVWFPAHRSCQDPEILHFTYQGMASVAPRKEERWLSHTAQRERLSNRLDKSCGHGPSRRSWVYPGTLKTWDVGSTMGKGRALKGAFRMAPTVHWSLCPTLGSWEHITASLMTGWLHAANFLSDGSPCMLGAQWWALLAPLVHQMASCL